MTAEPLGAPPYPRSLLFYARLGLTGLLLFAAVADPVRAGPHGGGARGGGHGNGVISHSGSHGRGQNHGGGRHSGAAHPVMRGRGGYGGWDGGYYPGPVIIYGSPFYCEPPLIYAPYGGRDYCE